MIRMAFLYLSSMTLIYPVQARPQVFTVKRSERQIVVSNGKDGGNITIRVI